MSYRYRLCILAVSLMALVPAACRDSGASHTRTRIESLAMPAPLPPSATIVGSAETLAALGADLAAVAPGVTIQTAADDAAALESVRRGDATAAVIAARTPGQPAGLQSVSVEGAPIALFVPFSFPVEAVSAQQARDLAAGRIQRWRDLGGPALGVDVAVQAPDAVGQALGRAVVGTAVDDPATALAARPGRVVFAPATDAGPAVKALRVDGVRPGESSYPLTLNWSVVGMAGDGRAPALAQSLAGRIAERAPRTVVLDAAGDIMLDRAVGASIASHGPRHPFEAVTPLFAGSDIRFANLEIPLTERGQRALKDYTFRAPPSLAEAMAGAGVNLLTLANNHSLDYGADGLLDTLAALGRAGIGHAGAGRNADEAHAPAIVTVNGLRIAFLGYVNTPNDSVSGWVAESITAGPATPGVAWGTPEAIRRDVTAARQRADLVIVAMHSGYEYTAPPNTIQRALAYAAIDAGAALVIGAHPHVLQGVEFYKNAPIVYSLGNFVFDLDDADRRQPGLPSVLSCVLRIRLGREGVRSLEVRPVQLDLLDGHPVPVSGTAARPVYDRIYSLTDALTAGR